jgi:sigma-E factor negative regulatory protein RseB
MTHPVLRALPALVLFQLGVGVALADPVEQDEAVAWLQRIADAARQLNYTGTFVYEHGDRAETSRITHFTDPTGEYEKLETLDGPRREVIRNNTEVLTFFFDKRVLRRERRTPHKTFPALLPDQLAALTQNYELHTGGRERVAGYDSQALILKPRDAFRYGHKLWAELKSGLLLKARMLNENREVIEQFHFTQVQINAPLTLASVQPSFPLPPLPPTEAQPFPAAADTGWTVRNQPAGFKKIMEMRRLKQDGRVPVAHLVYSDGLAAVSVFIEPLSSSSRPADGLSHQGAVTIYTKSLPDQLVTVLGETPAATVVQIGDSVALKGH